VNTFARYIVLDAACSVDVVDRLPDGFTQLHALTHAGLNDISLNRLPTDIGRQALYNVYANITFITTKLYLP